MPTASTTSEPRSAQGPVPADLKAWNTELNRTHAMAMLRERGGRLVRHIESRRCDLIAGVVRRLRPELVVDVGCEDGFIAQRYVDEVGELVLADLDGEALAASPLASHPRVRLVETDATAPRELDAWLGARRVDLVVLSALLEHLPDPHLALRSLTALVRPGGHLLVYLPADGPILFFKSVLKHTRLGGLVRGLSLEPAPGHLHRFHRKACQRLLAPYGRIRSLTFDPICLGYLALVRVTDEGDR